MPRKSAAERKLDEKFQRLSALATTAGDKVPPEVASRVVAKLHQRFYPGKDKETCAARQDACFRAWYEAQNGHEIDADELIDYIVGLDDEIFGPAETGKAGKSSSTRSKKKTSRRKKKTGTRQGPAPAEEPDAAPDESGDDDSGDDPDDDDPGGAAATGAGADPDDDDAGEPDDKYEDVDPEEYEARLRLEEEEDAAASDNESSWVDADVVDDADDADDADKTSAGDEFTPDDDPFDGDSGKGGDNPLDGEPVRTTRPAAPGKTGSSRKNGAANTKGDTGAHKKSKRRRKKKTSSGRQADDDDSGSRRRETGEPPPAQSDDPISRPPPPRSRKPPDDGDPFADDPQMAKERTTLTTDPPDRWPEVMLKEPPSVVADEDLDPSTFRPEHEWQPELDKDVLQAIEHAHELAWVDSQDDPFCGARSLHHTLLASGILPPEVRYLHRDDQILAVAQSMQRLEKGEFIRLRKAVDPMLGKPVPSAYIRPDHATLTDIPPEPDG